MALAAAGIEVIEGLFELLGEGGIGYDDVAMEDTFDYGGTTYPRAGTIRSSYVRPNVVENPYASVVRPVTTGRIEVIPRPVVLTGVGTAGLIISSSGRNTVPSGETYNKGVEVVDKATVEKKSVVLNNTIYPVDISTMGYSMKKKKGGLAGRVKRLESTVRPEVKVLEVAINGAKVAGSSGGNGIFDANAFLYTGLTAGGSNQARIGNECKILKIEVTGYPWGSLSNIGSRSDFQLVKCPAKYPLQAADYTPSGQMGAFLNKDAGYILKSKLITSDQGMTVKWVHRFRYPLTIKYNDAGQQTCNFLYLVWRGVSGNAAYTSDLTLKIFYIDP